MKMKQTGLNDNQVQRLLDIAIKYLPYAADKPRAPETVPVVRKNNQGSIYIGVRKAR